MRHLGPGTPVSKQRPAGAIVTRGISLLALVAAACTAGADDATADPFANPEAGGEPSSPGDGSGTGDAASPGGTEDPAGGGGDAPVAPLPDGLPQDATELCGSSDVGFPVLRRLSRRELEQSLRDVFSPVLGDDWASSMSADGISEAGFDNDSGQLVVSRQTAREIAATAESLSGVLADELAGSLLPCAATAPDAACAGDFLDQYGRRLFRRPLSDQERQTYLEFWQTAQTATGDFSQSIGWLARGLVQSPHFIYRREIGVAQGDLHQLDAFEIATELAYTFSGTTPSDALLDRAESGELDSPQARVETARELLVDSGGVVFQTFFDAYVGHARVTTIAKAGVPEFAQLRGAMLEETRRFIDEVVFGLGGGSRELLTADFTTPSADLARFYGFEGESIPQSDFERVARPEGRGIGLLAQGSVLATLSRPDGSSPTKRGQWVFSRLLCNTIPAVPPAIPELNEALEDGAQPTTRQLYEELHAAGACASCHDLWDPIGFAFEHYDEAGRYRADEGGLTIDAASYVPNGGQILFEFDGQEDLATQLAEENVLQECMTGFLTTFAFGEELTCAGESRRAEFMRGDIGFVDYMASLAGEPHFSSRRLE